MDNDHDNLLKRLSTVIWGLGIIALFGVLALFLTPWLTKDARDPVYEAQSKQRLATRATMEAAQSEALKVDPETVYAQVSSELLAMKPVAIETGAQVVPGSPTQLALAEGGAPIPETVENAADMAVDPAVMEIGKAQFMVCAACHGADGNGVPNLAPPLAGSEWVTGPVQNLIRIQLRGLIGPISVKGVDYNLVAPMAPMAYQTDDQIAAVLTYVRNSFGNKAPPVTQDQVTPLRGEAGKPFLKVEELIAPGATN